MNKVLPVLTYAIFVSYCLYMVWTFILTAKAQEQEEETECLTRQEVKDDHTLGFLRPVIGRSVDLAIEFFYSQVKLKDSKYFTTAMLVDRRDGGGMLLVGEGPDSYCSLVTIPPENWPAVEYVLGDERA